MVNEFFFHLHIKTYIGFIDVEYTWILICSVIYSNQYDAVSYLDTCQGIDIVIIWILGEIAAWKYIIAL